MTLWLILGAAFLFFSSGNAQEYLISVVNLPAQSRTDVKVIEAVHDVYLIMGEEETLRYLSKRRIAYTVLDKNPRQKKGSYYLVTPMAESVQTIRPVAAVLADYKHLVVAYVLPEQQDAFFELRVERALITFDPFLFNDAVPGDLLNHPTGYNDVIKEIVEKVSKDSARSYIRALCKFDRTARSNDNKTKMVPWLEKRFEEFGVDSVYTQPVSGYGSNVIAILRGTEVDQKKYCLIGGHSDVVPKYAGADDNGTGTAAALEAARVLAKYEFQNNIRFVAFNAEEVGLCGSNAYAKAAKDNGDQIIGGCINYDMVGYSAGTPTLYIHYSSSPAANKTFSELFLSTASKYSSLAIKLETGGAFHSSSDHYCFWGKGYAAFLGIEAKSFGGLCPGYHTDADTLDSPKGLNNSEFMTEAIRCAVAVLADLAKPLATSLLPGGAGQAATAFKVIRRGRGHDALLSFTVAHDRTPVTITIYSPLGCRVAILADNVYAGGTHTLAWPQERQTPGLYVVGVKSGSRYFSRKVLLH